VMDSGRVAEFSDPYSLLMDDKSLFHSLCKSSGDFDELLAIAKKSTNLPIHPVAI